MGDVTGRNLAGRSYGVVYSDVDTRFDLHSAAGEEKSPQAHYTCRSTPEICRWIKDLLEWACAPHSVHVMWTTWPMLARGDAHQIMLASGFLPKTGGAWGKLTEHGKLAFGTGYIYRSASEPWLLGTRGAPQSLVKDQRNLLLDDGLLDGGIMLDLVREHSRKPDGMIEAIERQFKGPYLELNARTTRPGWDVWGDEVGKFREGA